MGNSLVGKRRRGHEILRHDKRYFQRVEARNGRHNQQEDTSIVVIVDEDHGLHETRPRVGPLENGTKIAIPESFSAKQAQRRKEKQDLLQNTTGQEDTGMFWETFHQESSVTSVAVSTVIYPMIVAVALENGMLRVFRVGDFETQSEVCILGGKVRSLDFSPENDNDDRLWLAAGGDDCKAFLFRVDGTPECVCEMERPDKISAVRFHPHGTVVAVGGFDGKVAIYSVTASCGDLLYEIPTEGSVLTVDWSPSGRFLAVGGTDRACTVYDNAGEMLGRVTRNATVQTVKWHPHGFAIAIGSHDGTVVIADTDESFRIQAEMTRGKDGSQIRITSMDWSPHGHFLAVCGSDNLCMIVETQSYHQVQEFQQSKSIHCTVWVGLESLEEDSNHDELQYLVLAGDDKAVAMLKTNSSIYYFNHSSSSSTWEDDEDDYTTLQSGSSSEPQADLSPPKEDGIIEMRGDSTLLLPKLLLQTVGANKPLGLATAVAFSRSKTLRPSDFVAVATTNKEVLVYSTADWAPIVQMMFSSVIHCLRFSPEKNLLLLAGADATLHIISTKNWSIILEEPCSVSLPAIAFSTQGDHVAAGAADGTLFLWTRTKDWALAAQRLLGDSITCLAWSSKHLALATREKLEIHAHKEVVVDSAMPPEASIVQSNVHKMVFGFDGAYLATSDQGGVVRIYNAETGWILCHEIKLDIAVSAMEWSLDGRFLAFGGERNPDDEENQQTISAQAGAVMRVFDTLTWTVVYEETTKSVVGISWSNDSQWLIMAGNSDHCAMTDSATWETKIRIPQLQPS